MIAEERSELATVGGCQGFPQEESQASKMLVCRVEKGSRRNFFKLGRRLALYGDLFRNGSSGPGLIQVLEDGTTRRIARASDLTPLIADRIAMRVEKDGKVVAEMPGAAVLNTALQSVVFLEHFRPVDQVVQEALYLDDFTLTQPGYHDRGAGRRILHVGPPPAIGESTETLTRFLDVMDFASDADRTNAVAAALTVLLRHHWPGEKPIVVITATRSHAGKGTIAEMIRGGTSRAEVLYENVDWPMQLQFQKQVRTHPDIGGVLFDNVRLDSAGGRGRFIRSAFIESFVTNAEIVLASPGAGDPIRLVNRFVTVLNTNDGSLSEDLHNRSLPIHLAPRGSIHDRESPIGNPKVEFLPTNRDRIVAELRGMIERWRVAGMPVAEEDKHPMTPWARTIGGILKVTGFADFLGNRQRRRTADNPVHEAMGLLGAAVPGKALGPAELAAKAVALGLARTLFTTGERETEKGRERAIGVVLSRYLEETFDVQTETGALRLRLSGGYRRWTRDQNGHVRYIFELLGEETAGRVSR